MLTLYSRPKCHLCHQAAALLREAGVEYRELDISGDPELEAEFGWEIPVLADASGRVLLKGRFGDREVAALTLGL
ncbi:MAG TPA: glutaredoxin family protein [Deinococcales bacterium]|nr:glutaredoxin family protein [Deinococcales bacterium]